MKNYKITITPAEGCWIVTTYSLKDEYWTEMSRDAALFHWEARFIAWRLKTKLESDKFKRGEETIYEKQEKE